MTNDETRPERSSSRCILAWWDLDVQIGVFHKRKVTARPLKELERAIGHRLHVEERGRYDEMPDGVWKFEAFHYIDTADPALAAYAALKQICPLSEWFGMSWQGFNTTATTLADDPDKSTICAYYWDRPCQKAMSHYVSSGVQVSLVDLSARAFDRRNRYNVRARPVVQPPESGRCTDYTVEFTVHIFCSNKQDLMTLHWPRFQELHWPEGVAHIEVDARIHAGKPNVIRASQTLRGVREHEAIAYCLSYAPSFRIKLDSGPEFCFQGEQRSGGNGLDGITAFLMTRK